MPILSAKHHHAAPIPFGRINLLDPALQPPGTMLASITVPPTHYTHDGANGSTVLWKCDKADLETGDVYFLVSTNGDSRFGGYHEIGYADGLNDVYGTWFKYIGLRLSMNGIHLTRFWKKIPLTPENYSEVFENGRHRIHIRLGDLPPLQAELFKLSTLTPAGGHLITRNCAGYKDGLVKSPSDPTPEGTVYQCEYPNAYIQLHGPGLNHDQPGQDHNDHRKFRYSNGLGYRLYQAVTLSNTSTCVVHSATPLVRFSPISVQQLHADGGAIGNIHIEMTCDEHYHRVASGTLNNQTALGLQVSIGAFKAAQRLGLVKDGGVEYLLSDDDGKPGFAKGVGIGLYHNGTRRRFVGQPGSVGTGHPRGQNAGWYPVLQGAQKDLNSPPERRRYRVDFTARLMKLPQAQDITPGKVHATATVLVKVQ